MTAPVPLTRETLLAAAVRALYGNDNGKQPSPFEPLVSRSLDAVLDLLAADAERIAYERGQLGHDVTPLLRFVDRLREWRSTR